MLKGKLPSLKEKYGSAVVTKPLAAIVEEVKKEEKAQEVIKTKRSLKLKGKKNK